MAMCPMCPVIYGLSTESEKQTVAGRLQGGAERTVRAVVAGELR